MSENSYIKKQQRVRNKPLLTTRNILTLVLLSLAVYAGFYFEYGIVDDGTCEGICENQYSLGAWVLGFLMIFAAVIAAGAVIGGIIAAVRWSRKQKDDTLSALLDDTKGNPDS